VSVDHARACLGKPLLGGNRAWRLLVSAPHARLTETTVTDFPAAPGCAADLSAHAGWDAGDTGCGELLLELRFRMAALRAGERLRLVARDPGAIEDMPAWCRLTGHKLIQADHPQYLIERRSEP